MKSYFKIATMVTAVMSVFACSKSEVVPNSNASEQISVPTTKAYGDKAPKLVVYVETDDVNPLNAEDYMLPDEGISMIDIVELFAANIHNTITYEMAMGN